MNNRTIILILLVLTSGIAVNWLIDVADKETLRDPAARNDPDLYMVNPKISQFNDEGTIQHRINAERMTHFPLTDVTTLKVPNILLYSTAGSPPWDIVALNGRMLPRSQLRDETLELWDEVLAIKEQGNGDFINIQTESLTVYPDRDYAETSKKVYIDNASGRTIAGGGMKADFEAGHYEFFSGKSERVNTIIVPSQTVVPDDRLDGLG